MRNLHKVIGVLPLLWLSAGLTGAVVPAAAKSTSVVVSANSGGSVGVYVRKVASYQKAGTKVRFAGRCDSACTLLLALPRHNTCISPGAYFRFHAPTARNSRMARLTHLLMMRKYPIWVRSYLVKRGGLTRSLVTIDYSYASRFMKRCV